jgi:transmembrane sensor
MSSTVVNFDRVPQPEEEARKWVVRIDAGPLLPEERAQLRAWLAEDARHAQLLDEHALLWAAASRAQFPSPRVQMRRLPSWRKSSFAWSRSLAAACVALVAVALTTVLALRGHFGPGGSPEFALAVNTAIGEQRPVALPDGSRTELNASSTLRVAYSTDRRRVFLDRGEGLFSVAKDKARPFEVIVGSMTVRALGTRFLVERHVDGRVEVTVYEGVVEVTRQPPRGVPPTFSEASPEPVKLGVGQVAVGGADHTLVGLAEGKSMSRKLSWRMGRLEFDRTPLTEALEEVNRYSDQPIRLASESLQAIQVSGSFSTQDTGVFLRSLEQGFGLNVQRATDGWVVSRSE